MARNSNGKFSTIARKMKRAEKKVLIGYIRYARAHRDSNRLPLVLFILLFLDAFLMIIPSMLLTAAAVTITPKRWKLFAFLFILAVTLNNTVTYFMGLLMPANLIFSIVDNMGIVPLWESALQAVLQYGKYATFLGGFLPMPTQLVTMIIGMAEKQSQIMGITQPPSILVALVYGALGHGVKIFVFAGLVRFGWVKLEQKIAAKNPVDVQPKSK